MIEIMKASAGSGKTYQLSHKYKDLLLSSSDPYAYRHILAVTFTNKATAEMKNRILQDLYVESATDPRAKKVLENILHDYSAFAISTIDKFFQQALKAFSREIGRYASYQIELNRESLIEEAVDRILDSLTEDDRELLGWLKESMIAQLEGGEQFSFEKSLRASASSLMSEDFRSRSEQFSVDVSKAFSKDRLREINRECRRIREEFASKEDPSELDIRIASTVEMMDKAIYSLGISSEFIRSFDEVLKEKNVMCLDDSNTILRDIIDGSDAPFVYEKLGVRYENFLLDEFQDTSNIQWTNFLPLLRESDSNHHKSLVVGDVKQSIYRWRNSDWKLLSSGVGKAFPQAQLTTLEENWRSTANVVGFNNDFFVFAARTLGLDPIYSDVVQKVRSSDTQGGEVKVSFVKDQISEVKSSIATACSSGAKMGYIAIICRNNMEGASIASALISDGIPVVSDESLKIKSSQFVRRLVSVLSCLDNPNDKLNSYLSGTLSVQMPSTFHSLVDLSEDLIRQLRENDPLAFAGNEVYVQAFMDKLQAWTQTYGNNLPAFLEFWKEDSGSISSPEGEDAVRILTIHKSKGLEFPYLIFPFADKVDLYKASPNWYHLSVEGTGLPEYLSGLYNVSLTKGKSGDSLFREAYDEEALNQKVDNLNLFYVALTRAKCSLHIISAIPGPTAHKEISAGSRNYLKLTELLYKFCGCQNEFTRGVPYDFGKMERKESASAVSLDCDYPSYPLNGRLEVSVDAADFFSEEGIGAQVSARRNGILLHSLLSAVEYTSDLDSLCADPDSLSLLREAVAAHPEFFPADARIFNEQTLFDAAGREKRADRVIVRGSSVTVVDYKFGDRSDESDAKYIRQVRAYMDIYRKLGYADVKGFVWYVLNDETVEV